jgi:hypothetical protein
MTTEDLRVAKGEPSTIVESDGDDLMQSIVSSSKGI